MSKTKIVVVCGPTATGKTRLAVDIAKRFGGEIINADSMQVYRGMDIANATPTESERMGVKHHLFGIIEPEKAFSVVEWLTLAREKIAELSERSVLPVIVGGTGLYISSLVDNIIYDDIGGNLEFRKKMYELAETHGNSYILEKLREADPVAASKLHENNLKRVIRALETYEQSNGVQSAERLKKSREVCSSYDVCMLGLNFEDRSELYERINRRVDVMVENGLIEEARKTYMTINRACNEHLTAVQAIGHKELFPFFDGRESLTLCIENLKTKTRNYAKRQMTWFKKDVRIKWLFTNNEFKHVHALEKSVVILEEFVE